MHMRTCACHNSHRYTCENMRKQKQETLFCFLKVQSLPNNLSTKIITLKLKGKA